MLLGPTYPEIDSEREVVLEEIAMYEDEPQDKVHDVLDRAVFGGHPLGQAGARRGRGDQLDPGPRHRRLPPGPLHGREHRRRRRREPRSRRDRRARQAARRAPGRVRRRRRARAPASSTARRSPSSRRTPSSSTSPSAAPGSTAPTTAATRSRILDAVFGGSTSSRLFREVREKRGLAYAVGSYTQQYVDSGLIGLYVGTREDNVEEACGIIGRELASIHAEGITDEELARAKEHVKGRMVLSSESTAARMGRIGKARPLRHARC